MFGSGQVRFRLYLEKTKLTLGYVWGKSSGVYAAF